MKITSALRYAAGAIPCPFPDPFPECDACESRLIQWRFMLWELLMPNSFRFETRVPAGLAALVLAAAFAGDCRSEGPGAVRGGRAATGFEGEPPPVGAPEPDENAIRAERFRLTVEIQVAESGLVSMQVMASNYAQLARFSDRDIARGVKEARKATGSERRWLVREVFVDVGRRAEFTWGMVAAYAEMAQARVKLYKMRLELLNLPE